MIINVLYLNSIKLGFNLRHYYRNYDHTYPYHFGHRNRRTLVSIVKTLFMFTAGFRFIGDATMFPV